MISLKHRSAILLIAQLIYILTCGLWQKFTGSHIIPVALYVALFGAGGFVLANSRKWLAVYLLLAIFGIAFGAYADRNILQIVSIVLLTGSHILLFRQLFLHILKPTTLLQDRILSGIAGYLLLGIFWALQMEWPLLESAGAIIRNQPASDFIAAQDVLYYSFVTLTTLGYGDMAPVTWLAKAVSIFTSLSGVLYLAIFISAIVGSSDFRRLD